MKGWVLFDRADFEGAEVCYEMAILFLHEEDYPWYGGDENVAIIPPPGDIGLLEFNWERYINSRFRYKLEYPSVLIPQPEAANGDGREFIWDEKNASLIAYGSVNAMDQSLEEAFNYFIQDYEDRGANITYKFIYDSGFLISGYLGDRIFYIKQRRHFRGEEIAVDGTLIFEYPEVENEIFLPVWERLSQTFCFLNTNSNEDSFEPEFIYSEGEPDVIFSREITVSSSDPGGEKGSSYSADLAIDGDTETAWNTEGYKGKWIKFSFSNTEEIVTVGIIPGYDKVLKDDYGDRWVNNNRIEEATLKFSDGTEEKIFFTDERYMQYFDIIPPVSSDFLMIEINSVYPGSKDNDTCISEVEIYRVQ